MIRLRSMVREERPSWRSSRASERRASGRVAAEPVVMIARDQQALFRRGPGDHAGDEFEAIAQPRIGIGRAGIAEDPGARPAAARDALDELRGLLDPAASRAPRRHAGTSARASAPAGRRPPAPRRAFPRSARKRQPATSATRSITPLPARSTSSTSRTTPAAAPGTSAASVATAGCSTPSVGMMTLSMNEASLAQTVKNAALLSPCHNQISRCACSFLRQRLRLPFPAVRDSL